jgi:hypothetical protein
LIRPQISRPDPSISGLTSFMKSTNRASAASLDLPRQLGLSVGDAAALAPAQ